MGEHIKLKASDGVEIGAYLATARSENPNWQPRWATAKRK